MEQGLRYALGVVRFSALEAEYDYDQNYRFLAQVPEDVQDLHRGYLLACQDIERELEDKINNLNFKR